MLSRKTKYALHALRYLATQEDKGPVLIQEIAEKEHIPHKFLESILLELRNAGILGSKKGKGGGYYLIKKPEEIKFSKIIRMFHGPIAYVPCVSLNFYEKCENCEDESTCRLKPNMIEIRDAFLAVLDNKTIKDII